jgi:hypothetical protein
MTKLPICAVSLKLVCNRFTAPRIADEFFDGTMSTGRLDFLQRHRLGGFATERDGLEDSPFARTLGNASHLVPGPRAGGGDKL